MHLSRDVAEFCDTTFGLLVKRGYVLPLKDCDYCRDQGYLSCRVMPAHLSRSVLGYTSIIIEPLSNDKNGRDILMTPYRCMHFWHGNDLMATLTCTNDPLTLTSYFGQTDLMANYGMSLDMSDFNFDLRSWARDIFLGMRLPPDDISEISVLLKAHDIVYKGCKVHDHK